MSDDGGCGRDPLRYSYCDAVFFVQNGPMKGVFRPLIAMSIQASLPYIDTEFDSPETRAAVEAMIREEARGYAPSAAPQEFQFNFEKCPLARADFERLSSGMGSAPSPSVPPAVAPTGKAANDLKAWDAAIERAKANLAHQLMRNTNADLQLRHASNAHKVHNFVLEALQISAQAHDDIVADAIDDVNRSRQDLQLDAGKKLQQLHRRQLQLQHSVVVVQAAVAALEARADAAK